jgi:hypothetical protein
MEVIADGSLHDIGIGGLPHFLFGNTMSRVSICFAQIPRSPLTHQPRTPKVHCLLPRPELQKFLRIFNDIFRTAYLLVAISILTQAKHTGFSAIRAPTATPFLNMKSNKTRNRASNVPD